MKKILSTVAALGLVAGIATTASAWEFSMTGNYTLEGYYLESANGAGVLLQETAGTDNPSDAYWLHSFSMVPTMKVNDAISMLGEIRLADDSIWGNQADGDLDAVKTTRNDVYVHRLYMQYMSPIGKIQMGRLSSGAWGTAFLNNDSRADGFKFWPSFLASGPWSTYFATTKAQENDGDYNLGANTESDQDSDNYEARVYYKDDAIDAGVRFVHNVNKTTATQDTDQQTYGIYTMYKRDNYFMNLEIISVDGDTDYDAAGTADTDVSAAAAFFQIGATFDNLTVSGAYIYASGDDNANDNTQDNVLGSVGSEFEPLYILTGSHMGLLNTDIQTADSQGYGLNEAGAHAFAVFADYQTSDRLTLHGAIAYAQADEEYQAGAAASYQNRDDEYGWEYNLGAAYKLMDNLTYEAHFGYLDTGDFFNSGTTTNDAENVYIASHSLTMTF